MAPCKRHMTPFAMRTKRKTKHRYIKLVEFRRRSFIHSFIHSFMPFLYRLLKSRPTIFRSAPDKARILCRSSTPKHHRQLRVKDLTKVPAWRLERDSNPRPCGRKASTLPPMRHHVPHLRSISALILKFLNLCVR